LFLRERQFFARLVSETARNFCFQAGLVLQPMREADRRAGIEQNIENGGPETC